LLFKKGSQYKKTKTKIRNTKRIVDRSQIKYKNAEVCKKICQAMDVSPMRG